MHSGKIQQAEANTSKSGRRPQLATLAFGIISLVLLALAWSYPGWVIHTTLSPFFALPLLFTLYAFLTVIFFQVFSGVSIRKKWSYRLALFLSAGFALLQVCLNSFFLSSLSAKFPGFGRYWPETVGGSLAMILFLCLGSFVGALVSTAWKDSMMEINSPPAQLIAGVYQRHLETIGLPGEEPVSKRAFDVILASIGLVFSAPVWLACTLLLWIEDPGPVLYVKNSTGKSGKNFRLFKFRTMTLEMEKQMALVQTQEVETKTLLVGRFLRKSALDELPQLINILKNEMSFVGPRPHRTTLVEHYLSLIPEFAERHQVLPGLSGLAQVSGDFYMTARQKLRFDRLYIQHRSLGFDIKLLFLAFTITFWYRWQKDWQGRLPRRLLHKSG
jgi:lipopolysaccharide/colanic/teichoic acid biosynthesis glycosyltransferase